LSLLAPLNYNALQDTGDLLLNASKPGGCGLCSKLRAETLVLQNSNAGSNSGHACQSYTDLMMDLQYFAVGKLVVSLLHIRMIIFTHKNRCCSEFFHYFIAALRYSVPILLGMKSSLILV
jgi:hypothetical protein